MGGFAISKTKRRNEVMTKRRTLDEQIELAQEELKKKEARIKELLGRQRTKSDKDRTHRLCRRGGLVEKLLPNMATITDEQFETFVERILLTGEAEKVLAELTPSAPMKPQSGDGSLVGDAAPKPESGADSHQGGISAPPESAKTVTQTDTAHNSGKPAGADNNSNANSGGNRSNSTSNTKPANAPHNNGANGNPSSGNGSRHVGQGK
jgi:hypothetical protein